MWALRMHIYLEPLNMYTQIMNELFHPLSLFTPFMICSQHLALANQEIPQLYQFYLWKLMNLLEDT